MPPFIISKMFYLLNTNGRGSVRYKSKSVIRKRVSDDWNYKTLATNIPDTRVLSAR